MGGFDELNYAIRTMLKGGFYMPPSMSATLVDPTVSADPVENLTVREKSVFSLYAQGYGNQAIANTLHISVKTSETRLGSLAGSRYSSILIGVGSAWLPCLTGRPTRMNEYMSMEFPESICLSPRQRRAWAESLGRVIAYVRERRGLSAAAAARLAGMEPSQWETIEDGKPTLGTPEQFQAMAEILGIDWGVKAGVKRNHWGAVKGNQ
jgi:hypothetical protein